MQFIVKDNKASKCPHYNYLCSLQCFEICKDLKLAFS